MSDEVKEADVDDELVDLLETIRADEEPEKEEDPAEAETTILNQEPEPDLEELPEIEPEPEREVVEPELEERVKPEAPPPTEIVPAEESEDIAAPLRELAKKFSETLDGVFENATKDRTDMQEVVDFCKDKLAGDDRIVQEVVMESWVKAAAAKAEININKTKLLDSIAKLLAAAKNNNMLFEINVNTGDDLEAILNQEEKFDEIDDG